MDGYDFRTSSHMYVSRQVVDFSSYTCVHCQIFLQYYSEWPKWIQILRVFTYVCTWATL